MKLFILGTGKSGTTAMVYKVAGGLPNCQAFSGGKPGKYAGHYENAVFKHTYEERKGKSFGLYKEHLEKENYDRKIWMARDPRDVAVSRMLYRWHKGYFGSKKQYQAHLSLVLLKEKNSKSIPFYEICRYIGRGAWPVSREEILEKERLRYKKMRDFVKELGGDWFLFKYEDMVDNKFDALNVYLGFEVKETAEVPKKSGKAKVIRKKKYGDWRNWFTDEDMELFRSPYTPYMKLLGYDCEDWALKPEPIIEPEYSSEYIKRLTLKGPFNVILQYLNRLTLSVSKKN